MLIAMGIIRHGCFGCRFPYLFRWIKILAAWFSFDTMQYLRECHLARPKFNLVFGHHTEDQ